MEPRRVLVVDDEPDIRLILDMALSQVPSWQVISVASGADCLREALHRPPDVILLDVMMPGMDGPETFQGLRAQPRTATIPVIFLTARQHERDRTLYQELGAAGVIAKPFDVLTLADQIASILAWR